MEFDARREHLGYRMRGAEDFIGRYHHEAERRHKQHSDPLAPSAEGAFSGPGHTES